MDRPVFVGGCMRSGTTLLMQLLDCARNIAMPPYESYFMANFYGCQARCPSTKLVPPEACLPHLARLARGNFGEFCESDWVKAEIRSARTYAAAFDIVCREMARQVGKGRWGDKTPGNEYFAADILEYFPSSRFIYVQRDPRDVVSSKRDRSAMAGRGWRSRLAEVWRSAWLWRSSDQAHAWNLKNLDPTRHRGVRFEHLVEDPSAVLGELSDFLEEDLGGIVEGTGDRAVFRQLGQGTHSPRGGSSNTSYQMAAPPPGAIDRAPVGRHRTRLSALERFAVAALCSPTAKVFARPHPPTSHKRFGPREKRLAYRHTRKAKFWFGQGRRRLTAPTS